MKRKTMARLTIAAAAVIVATGIATFNWPSVFAGTALVTSQLTILRLLPE